MLSFNPTPRFSDPNSNSQRHGQCGAELSDRLLPWLAKIADKYLWSNPAPRYFFNHAPRPLSIYSIPAINSRRVPSMGSWLSYGLGSEADDLPSILGPVLTSGTERRGGDVELQAFYKHIPRRAVPQVRRSDPACRQSERSAGATRNDRPDT